jgi:hypothetical protein
MKFGRDLNKNKTKKIKNQKICPMILVYKQTDKV